MCRQQSRHRYECAHEYQIQRGVDTFTILVVVRAGMQKFGFGKTRLSRFIQGFDQAEYLDEDYCTWEDQIEILRQECGLDLSIRKNDKDVRVR